jgi:hypothetical protein
MRAKKKETQKKKKEKEKTTERARFLAHHPRVALLSSSR